MTRGTTIVRVGALAVWDSRGRPTVEAEVALDGGATGRAIAPSGASRGRHEAHELRDGGAWLGGAGVGRAVAAVNEIIAPALRGRDAADQTTIDAALVALDDTTNRTRLGANALVAVSMACAHASAAARGLPLWRHLAGDRDVALPLPEIQIFGGGAHAAGRVDVQDFLVVAPGAASFGEALAWTAEVYHAAGALLAERGALRGVADEGGFWPEFASNEQAIDTLVAAIERCGHHPGDEIAIALDVAASELRDGDGYRLGLEQRTLDTGAMIDLLGDWIERYPIVSVEDPLGEDDDRGMVEFTARYGSRVQVIGDDYLVTDAIRVAAAADAGACNAVLLKPNQRGTLTETRAAWDAARANGFGGVVSARSGETEDVTIVHLAVGWGVPEIKVGSFARSERMAKWNEGLRIEASLGSGARFAGAAALAPAAPSRG